MTVLGWMLYALAIGLLLGGAAMAVEYAQRGRGRGRPVRYLWAAAVAASVGMPLAALIAPRWPLIGSDALAVPLDRALEGVVVLLPIASAAVPARPELDQALVLIWILASAGLAGFVLGAYQALRHHGRKWPLRNVGGRVVRVAPRIGPGVYGFLRPEIVLPDWSARLGDEFRRLIVVHEAEHLAAGDHRLVAMALLAVIVMPWNPILWWQVHRLRVAVELDCDRRVLSRGVDRQRYARALFEASRRRSVLALMATAFSTPRTSLERRLLEILGVRPRASRTGSAAALGLAGLLLAIACQAPTPAGDKGSTQKATSASSSVDGSDAKAAAGRIPSTPERDPGDEELQREPVFTPYTVRPELIDKAAAIEGVERSYPRLLRVAGIGGTVDLWIFVDREGAVRNARVAESSGRLELDRAAIEAARRFEFRPAFNRSEPVPVWISIPITYSLQGADRRRSS